MTRESDDFKLQEVLGTDATHPECGHNRRPFEVRLPSDRVLTHFTVVFPLSTQLTWDCKKFKIDTLGDHVSACTGNSGAKKKHAWVVEQLADLCRTTTKVKKTQVVRSRGQRCGEIKLVTYLTDTVGPVNLVIIG